ncbi:MAG: hypothetical protein ACI8PT_002934 [Gammaproteobacteria bacterium]|jgi:hypothetical protein
MSQRQRRNRLMSLDADIVPLSAQQIFIPRERVLRVDQNFGLNSMRYPGAEHGRLKACTAMSPYIDRSSGSERIAATVHNDNVKLSLSHWMRDWWMEYMTCL